MIFGSAVPLSACSSSALAITSRTASGTPQWSRIFSTLRSKRAAFFLVAGTEGEVRPSGLQPVPRLFDGGEVGGLDVGHLAQPLAQVAGRHVADRQHDGE